MIHTKTFTGAAGVTHRAIPAPPSGKLTDVLDYGVTCTEVSAGGFMVTLDDSEFTHWYIFEAASNPTDWDEWVWQFNLDQGALTEQYDTATMIDSFNRFAITGTSTPALAIADIGLATGTGLSRAWSWTASGLPVTLSRQNLDGTLKWVIVHNNTLVWLGHATNLLGNYVAWNVTPGATGAVTLAKKQIARKAWRFTNDASNSIAPPGPTWPGLWSNMSGAARHEVLTLNDMVHSLTLRSGAQPSDRHNARMVKAIQSAIRSLHTKHPWTYYKSQTRFTTSPEVAMEITYDRTGGSTERLVTITSDSEWPADAAYGELFIGDKIYRVHRRLSDTTATLEPDHSPSADYTGEATWRRRAYSFGREIIKVEYAHNITANRPLTSLPHAEFGASAYSQVVSGYTRNFSWQNHGGKFGGSEFVLHPAPIAEETIEVSALMLPIVPTITSVTGTDMAGSSGGYTLTSTAGAFSSRHVGCIVRVSINSTAPTELNSDNWDFQAFVTAVNSATSITISDPLPQSYSARGYVISSPIDIEASVMLEALEDEAFYQYTKNHDHEKTVVASNMAKKSLLEAMTRDRRTSDSAMDAGTPFWNLYKSDFSNTPMDE
jgi:hypothetical protein